MSIPKGWFAAEDNENNRIDIWLIKDDYSASMNLIPLNCDEKTKAEFQNDYLKTLLGYSKTFIKIKHGKLFEQISPDSFFELNSRRFASYIYKIENQPPVRIVVFEYAGSYFEFSLIPKENYKNKNEEEMLFKIQDAVLAVIE